MKSHEFFQGSRSDTLRGESNEKMEPQGYEDAGLEDRDDVATTKAGRGENSLPWGLWREPDPVDTLISAQRHGF